MLVLSFSSNSSSASTNGTSFGSSTSSAVSSAITADITSPTGQLPSILNSSLTLLGVGEMGEALSSVIRCLVIVSTVWVKRSSLNIDELGRGRHGTKITKRNWDVISIVVYHVTTAYRWGFLKLSKIFKLLCLWTTHDIHFHTPFFCHQCIGILIDRFILVIPLTFLGHPFSNTRYWPNHDHACFLNAMFSTLRDYFGTSYRYWNYSFYHDGVRIHR